jgi:hypothetical protein
MSNQKTLEKGLDPCRESESTKTFQQQEKDNHSSDLKLLLLHSCFTLYAETIRLQKQKLLAVTCCAGKASVKQSGRGGLGVSFSGPFSKLDFRNILVTNLPNLCPPPPPKIRRNMKISKKCSEEIAHTYMCTIRPTKNPTKMLSLDF